MRKMKDSGIAWVGPMPVEWNIKRGKFTLRLLNRPINETDEVITCFRDGEVTLRKNRREDGFTVSLKEIGYQGIEPGDLVVHGMDGFAGSIGISDSRGKSSPVLVVCDSDENKKYIMYYLRSMAYNDVFTALATGIRVRSCDLRWNKIAELPYILPTIAEQNKIVQAIDDNTEKVDLLIANVQAQIEKLKAYKQSLITEVVTKGLDPNAPMKESGVEWIGMIPEHWRLVATKYLFSILSGATPKSEVFENWDGDIAWITPADYKTDDVYVSGGRRNLSELGFQTCSTSLIPKNSIIFSKRAPIGAVAINTNELCTNQGCLSCVNKDDGKIDSKYFYYTMSVATEQYELLGSGTTFKEISASNFENFLLMWPPITEQKAMVEYLDGKCSRIGRLISIKEAKITKLEQYKKSLIYEYVTGKKEVS